MLHISHSCLHERVNYTDYFGHQSTYLFTVDPKIDLLDPEQLFQDPDGLDIFAEHDTPRRTRGSDSECHL